MTDDAEAKRALIARLVTGQQSDREIADMMAKWTLQDLEGTVEVICPRPTDAQRVGQAPFGL